MPKSGQQLSFRDPLMMRPKDVFGGHLLKNSHAKRQRPLDSRWPVHLVMASDVAKGTQSLRHPAHFQKVQRLVGSTARKYGVRICQFANAGNHLHLLIKLPTRKAWAGFIRELSGRIAQAVAKQGKFWRQRPFTRIVRGWGRAYRIVKDYVVMNFLEAEGFVRRQDRATWRQFSSA